MDVRSRSVDVGLQFSLDLVVREEGLVAGVSDCQGIPVLEQCGPGLEQPGGEGREGGEEGGGGDYHKKKLW